MAFSLRSPTAAAAAAALGVVASLAFVDPAAAAPTATERETARGLMAEGRAARARGDLNAAMKAFAGADAVMHVPTTGFELAKAQAAAGLLVEARDTALRAARIEAAPGEPGPFRQARQGAIALETELGARIPSIRVSVKNIPPEGAPLKVEVDDIQTPEELIEQPIRVNPGLHTVVAWAGTVKVQREVEVAEKESRDVSIELPPQEKQDTAKEKPSGTTTLRDEKEATDQPGTADRPAGGSRGSPVLTIAGFSVAGAGALAGLATGIASMSKTSGVKSSGVCQNGGTLCNPSEDGDIRSARTLATASDVSFVLAGAGGVVGVIGLFAVGGSPSPSPQTSAEPTAAATRPSVEPWIGLGALGLRGCF
jgi:hypothetical protein